MSDAPKPAWRTILVSLVLTAAFTAIAYFVWTYANTGARKFAGGTLLTDLRFFLGLLAVYLALTVLDRVVGIVKAKLPRKLGRDA
ncbi:hypothetical protein [Roseibium sp.]|uniref:hypothetical protein n=1 Tax=Roseibium sp. TaxID=1936156 RepID=UPI003D0A012C